MISIQVSRTVSGGIAEHDERVLKAAQTFTKGAPLAQDNTDSTILEHAGGVVVVGLLGFATAPANRTDFPDIPPGKVTVAIANDSTRFHSPVISAGAFVVDIKTQAIFIGEQFGLLEVSGVWGVDLDETTSLLVEITRIEPDLNVVEFKVLPSAQQII